MNLSTSWKRFILIAGVCASFAVSAVTPEEEEANKKCVKPKFRDFAPAALAEVTPGSALSFHISKGANPNSVLVTVRKQKVPVEVKNKGTFLLGTAQFPADSEEGFARIHVEAKAEDGGCLGQDGWLVSIKPKSAQTSPADAHAAPAKP